MITGLDFTSRKTAGESLSGVRKNIILQLTTSARNAWQTPVESTHQVRKKLKFFRAFLKLLKNSGTEQAYKTANAFLRDEGSAFSGLRDAHVRSLLIDEMKSHALFAMFYDLLDHMHSVNSRIISEAEHTIINQHNRFSVFADKLEKSTELELFFLNINPSSQRILQSFLGAFAISRDAYNDWVIYPSSDCMHEWRKRLKDVQYQMEIILGIDRCQILPEYITIAGLCDILGRVNDLYMMKEWIRNTRLLSQYREDIPALISELKQANNTLQREAEQHGNTLYALPVIDLETILQLQLDPDG